MSETLQKTWEASATVKFIHVMRLHANTMECGMENREQTPNSGFYKAKYVICSENSTEKPLEMVPYLYFKLTWFSFSPNRLFIMNLQYLFKCFTMVKS